MKPSAISIRTTLSDYGLVTITGNVSRDKDFDPITEGCAGSPWHITGLRVADAEGADLTDDLDNYETEQAEECLIERFQDEEISVLDRMVDEAIQRGQQYKHMAYA